ncbi:MAG TPA: hypothetical protein VMT85_21335 [Thermoanaerobaculia bacterium]|nr:hypothetical protein [Thermoanaerobaculia bacterium]
MTRKPSGGSGTTSAPRWAIALLARFAPPARADDRVSDLEEAHRARAARRGRALAALLTGQRPLVIASTLLRRRGPGLRSILRRRALAVSWLDVKVGLRLLLRYPGLTVVGGLAIAACVAVGTFEFVNQVVSPSLPLPGGDRIVGVQVRDRESASLEPRVLHAARSRSRSPARWRQDPGERETELLERFASSVAELEERLIAHPEVAGVTLADRLPRMPHPARLIELDDGGAAPPPTAAGPASNCVGSCAGYRVAVAAVDLDYFEVLQTPVLAGRGFEGVAAGGSSRPVIVNRSFVERVMGGATRSAGACATCRSARRDRRSSPRPGTRSSASCRISAWA